MFQYAYLCYYFCIPDLYFDGMDRRTRNREYSREYRARQQAVKAAASRGSFEAYAQLDKKLKQFIKRTDDRLRQIEVKMFDLESTLQNLSENALYLDTTRPLTIDNVNGVMLAPGPSSAPLVQ